MRFAYDKETGDWISECGNYRIWIQARPRHDSPHWGAQYREERPWLTEHADGRVDARQTCIEHAERA